jgi:hypothetical protein
VRNRAARNESNRAKEIAMKKILFVVLAAALACAHVTGASHEDELAGRWRGVLTKGDDTNVVQFDFQRVGDGYRGNYWTAALTGDPVPLSDIHANPGVHFKAGQVGVFDGRLHGETIDGTFVDGIGSGSFTMEKLPDFDDQNLAGGETTPAGIHPRTSALTARLR